MSCRSLQSCLIVALALAPGLALALPATAQSTSSPATPSPATSSYDAALAQSFGADDRGMRSYVLAILKTGPRDAVIANKEERAALFEGHFANMARLANEGHLVLAGPLGGEDGRRGLFILATPDIETARQWVDTDPTVEAGVFVVEYSRYYGSAALMGINGVHATLQKPSQP